MDKTTSRRLFLLCCIPLRISLVFLPFYIHDKWRWSRLFSLLLLAISLWFFVLYFGNLRLNAMEGGGVTWWADFRLLHGSFYFAAAVYAFYGKIIAWIPLAFDVLLAIGLFGMRYLERM